MLSFLLPNLYMQESTRRQHICSPWSLIGPDCFSLDDSRYDTAIFQRSPGNMQPEILPIQCPSASSEASQATSLATASIPYLSPENTPMQSVLSCHDSPMHLANQNSSLKPLCVVCALGILRFGIVVFGIVVFGEASILILDLR